jgi:hypothetical protein
MKHCRAWRVSAYNGQLRERPRKALRASHVASIWPLATTERKDVNGKYEEGVLDNLREKGDRFNFIKGHYEIFLDSSSDSIFRDCGRCFVFINRVHLACYEGHI